MNHNAHKGRVRATHKALTSYNRYSSIMEDDDITSQYIVDSEGGLHDMSGNIESKVASVEKSKLHWQAKLQSDPKDGLAQRFYNKFVHLSQQIEIWLDSNEVLAHI